MLLQTPIRTPRTLVHAPHHANALAARYADILARGNCPLIVDCGANIGASAVWFSARYPEARIIAIEPAPQNAAILRRNVEPLGIDVIEAAIGPEDGSAFLHGHSKTPLSGRVTDGEHGEPVKVVSLQAILEQAHHAEPFILKIDIEGGEKTLFQATPDLLAAFPLIVIEPHDFCMPGDDVSRAFFTFHAAQGRDFVFAHENIFSVDYKALTAPMHAVATKPA